jgi:thiol-disulfide isomerase/thioredoxin/mono/diheme cytochrome c family protein
MKPCLSPGLTQMQNDTASSRPLSIRYGRLALVAVCGLLAWSSGPLRWSHAEAPAGLKLVGRVVDLDFSLPSSDGKTVVLKTTSSARLRAISFLGCDCPVAKLYAPRLKELAERFAAQGVEFVGINSNPQDTIAKMETYAREHGLDDPAVDFALLKDHDGQLALRLGASRTPEVFLIDSLGQVIYQGRIDDQYRPGVITDQPTREDLRIAIEEYLAGKSIAVASTPAAGCRIALRRPIDPTAEVTYARDISRILNRHCVECHRSGEIGPFALTDYEEIVGWGDMIVEVIQENRMPPWHASEDHSKFVNSRLMSDREKETVGRWVEAGAPFGNASDLEPVPEFSSGWQIGQPDLVLPMAAEPFQVPAGGTVEYQYFVVDPGFTEDRWVAAAEVVPGNRAVVHHGIAFIRPPDGVQVDGLGWLSAYVPGQRMPMPQPHRARKVPAGSKIVFQMHYTPTGKVEHDLSKIGLRMANPHEVTEEVLTIVGINQAIEIFPRQANVTVNGETEYLPKGGRLLAMSPHMHLRGKAFQVQIGKAGNESILLDVPHYDFNWQHTYILEEPIELDSIDRLTFTATYDNSDKNPFNPDPDEFVTWGDQTWEEMAIVFYEVARPVDQQGSRRVKSRVNSEETARIAKASDSATGDRDASLEAQADQFFRDLDRNRDGVIDYSEVDRAVQLRLFRRIDRSGNRSLDREEVLEYLRGR